MPDTASLGHQKTDTWPSKGLDLASRLSNRRRFIEELLKRGILKIPFYSAKNTCLKLEPDSNGEYECTYSPPGEPNQTCHLSFFELVRANVAELADEDLFPLHSNVLVPTKRQDHCNGRTLAEAEIMERQGVLFTVRMLIGEKYIYQYFYADSLIEYGNIPHFLLS